MFKNLLLTILLLFPLLSASQTLNGKVYDAETTVKGALIVNMSQKVMTYTNDEGNFSISAKVKDTFYVSSLFHTKSLIEIKASDFEDIMVIEIKKAINELDAILLREERQRQFDSIALNQQVDKQLKEDIQDNPLQYSAPPSGNIDFLAVGKLIGSLFKKKNKAPEFKPITYESLKDLFEKDYFFDATLLTVDLNIPEQSHNLFFEYVSTKNLDSNLMEPIRQIELIEALVVASDEFKKILDESKKDP